MDATIGSGATSAARSTRALIRACRPRQWAKNVLVGAAPGAAGVFTRGDVALHTAEAFIVLCLLASATYLVNDVRDVDDDRRHPRKRLRPIAAGDLPIATALRAAAVMGATGLALAFAVAPMLGVTALGYLALTTTYSLRLRHVAWLDLLAIAGGFVLRALAGSAATGVSPSRPFLLVITLGALFIVAGKRLSELVGLPSGAGTRASLLRCTPRALVAFAGVAAVGMLIAYGFWAFGQPEHAPFYEASLVVLMAWLARYAMLLARGLGDAPEELVLGDRVLVSAGAIWLALLVTAVYAH